MSVNSKPPYTSSLSLLIWANLGYISILGSFGPYSVCHSKNGKNEMKDEKVRSHILKSFLQEESNISARATVVLSV